MLCLLALGMTFRERGWDGLGAAPPARDLAAANAAGSFAAISLAGSGALLLAAAAVVWAGVDARRAPFATPALLSPPTVTSPWRPLGVTRGTWRPSFPGADSEIFASYAGAGRRVDLYLAYYDYERQGAEVVNELNKFADGKVWRRVGGGGARARLEGRPRTLGTVRLVSPAGGRLVWYWYWVDGRFTSNPFVAKVLQAKVRLWGGVEAAAVIAVAAPEEGAPGGAAEVLRGFLEGVEPMSQMLMRAAAPEYQAPGHPAPAR
jgi:EpsI family protein